MNLNAIMVCVDYWDLLAISLPYNRHHFNRVMVVTSPVDTRTMEVCVKNDVEFYTTNSFYEPGAVFNKWKALEEGLDHLDRKGWMCIMDADILWPKHIDLTMVEGCLYTPRRRIFDLDNCFKTVALQRAVMYNESLDEATWKLKPMYNEVEFAGYTQIFHADDVALGEPPWHDTNWRHCGGADSFFQRKWPDSRKVRPTWECLHLGRPACNWYGRATPYLDGTPNPQAEERQRAMRGLFNRHRGGNYASERY